MRPIAALCLAAASALTPALAAAQTRAAPAVQPAAGQPAPAAGTPEAAVQAALTRGGEAYHTQQWPTALAAFRDAAARDPRNALPQLYVGCALASQGNAASALGAFREAARLAQAAGDDKNRARALAAIAALHETQGRWDDARTTWTEYVPFGDAHPQVTFPAVARARNEAIGRRAALDTEYAPVRERIAERQRINAAGPQPPTGTAATPGAAPTTAPLPVPRIR